jgi:hypothetical protein
MLYGLPSLSSVTDVLTFETKDYFLKKYILGLSSTLLSLRIKGLLAQAPPLDFHLYQPGDYVLIKTWKEKKLEPAWEGPFLVLVLILYHRNSHVDRRDGVDSSHLTRKSKGP